MTEWKGDTLWWQDGVQLEAVCINTPASAVAVSCDRTAADSHVAVEGQSTPKSSKGSTITSDKLKNDKKYLSDPPIKRQPWFEFLPLQASVKPTLRPKHPCSQKNIASIDKQAAREQQAAEGRAARYMQQAAAQASHNHHHMLQLGPAGAIPQEHVVLGDRGKHRPAWCRSSLIFDPITSTSRPVTAPGRTESRAGLLSPCKSSIPSSKLAAPSDAPGSRDGSNQQDNDSSSSSKGHGILFFAGNLYHTCNGELITLQRRPSSACGVRTRYNPLTHTWTEPPDAAALQKWEKEADKSYSRSPGSTGSRSGWYEQGGDTVGSLLRQQSNSGQDAIRPASAEGRRPVRAGETWGTYDMLQNKWVVPPTDDRYATREMGPGGYKVDRLPSAGGLKPMRKAVTPPSAGVYDPIRGQWKVLPKQQRAALGLDFAPRKLFEEAAFVKR